MSMSEVTPAPGRAHRGWIYCAIVVEGVVTIASALLALPLALALVAANVVLAVLTHGTYRKLFAGVAIAGFVVCLGVVLTLFTARF